MADLSFMRTPSGLVPADEQAAEWFAKVRMGQTVAASVRLPRNWRFHRKFFAMLNVAYANYDWPQIDTKWGAAQCSFDSFREYVTVRAGHWEIGLTAKGEPRARPKSISFANMDEATFQTLYSDVLNVILMEFLDKWDEGDMERAVETMMRFT